MMIYLSIFAFFLGAGLLHSEDAPATTALEKKNLEVQLIEPSYQNGVLSSVKGGVVRGEDFFLQAKKIRYVRRQEEGKPVHKIYAEGDLFIEFRGRFYTGEKVEVDADLRKSIITNGCTMIEPWYVGGKIIELEADGSGAIHNGYMTTSENEDNDWSIESKEVALSKGAKIKARNVRFCFVKLPLLWLPTFTTDLHSEHKAPFKYRFRAGGRLGPRVGITYDLFKYKHFTSKVLFDILLKKGIGGGLEMDYENPEARTKFSAFNYAAHDLRSKEEHKYIRYRFKGNYDQVLFSNNVNLNASYDKLSDLQMRGDYVGDQIKSGRIAPTQIRFSKRSEDWISSFNTKVRVNNFQTIKQELPLLQFNARPVPLGSTGILLNNRFSTGFLEYKYATRTPHVHDFHSTRTEISQDLYRNFLISSIVATPRIGYTAISYNNSPKDHAENLVIGKLGMDAHMRFMRPFFTGTQIAQPYAQYDYLTIPTVGPRKHYIFDLQDGWHKVNTVRFGLKNFFMIKDDDNFLKRFQFDLYSRAFINTPTISRSIPRIYADASWKATPYTAYSIGSAWDTKRRNMDHINLRSEITLSEDAALTLEYRHRNSFSWRKLDHENFIIDSFRSEKRLRNSQLSDRRDTILIGLFLRLTPTISLEFMSRNGWRRHKEPAYNAYEVNLVTIVRGALKLNFTYELRGKKHEWSMGCSLGIDKPKAYTGTRKIGQGNYDN